MCADALAYEFNSINDHQAGLTTSAERPGRADGRQPSRWHVLELHRLLARPHQHQQQPAPDRHDPGSGEPDLHDRPVLQQSAIACSPSGVGRLYVPWATSLGVVDGGYVARRFGTSHALGAFAGSTPDPTAWNYKPNRQIAGVFANTEIGKFENVRITTTVGLAVTRLSWKAERQFAFTESSFSYKQCPVVLSQPRSRSAGARPPGQHGKRSDHQHAASSLPASNRVSWLTLDLNHNYFRTIPTFDLGAGRHRPARQVPVFRLEWRPARATTPAYRRLRQTSGRTSRNDDVRKSLNQMYGVGIPQHLQPRHSRRSFAARFLTELTAAAGMQALQLSREIGERLRLEISGGQQEFRSLFTD